MKTDEIEKAFQEHLDEKLGSSTRRKFYGNSALVAIARTAFTAGARSRDKEIEQLRGDLDLITKEPWGWAKKSIKIRKRHGLV